MEIKATLQKPYTEEEQIEFVVEYNHNLGYEINETETELQALGYTEAELEEQEKERIANIALTRADVFEALILARGLTKQMLRSFIEQDETLSEIERALYLNRFDDALEFYRKHPAIDFISAKLDITPDNMDKFFDTKDYMYLKPTTDVNNSEATGKENPVVEDITDVEDVNSLEG